MVDHVSAVERKDRHRPAAILGAAPLEVRQRQITIERDRARVTANLTREDERIGCDVTLHRSGDRWLLERVRVMG